MHIRHLFNLLMISSLVTLAAGCGKKDAAAPLSETKPAPEVPANNAAVQPPPSQAAPASTAPTSQDAIIAERGLAYLRGLVARKDYAQAREALKMFNGRTLTPAQQKTFNDLKAQVPAQ